MSGRSLIVGLTGGIGAGKTTAAQRFCRLGARVLDADAVSRASLLPGGACFRAVTDAFGPSILRADGAIDRAELSRIVFSDEDARARLNAIVHPHVIRTLLLEARAATDSDSEALIVLDVPLLFECGMQRDVDVTLLVDSSDAVRASRVCRRNGLCESDALKRIRAQMPQSVKARMADYILFNDGPLEALLGQTDALFQLLILGAGA